MERSVLELFLPEGILTYFDVSSVGKSADGYTIHLAEMNLHPTEFVGQKLVSKGFLDEVRIKQYFWDQAEKLDQAIILRSNL